MAGYIVVISGALLLIVVAQLSSANDDDMYQRPIESPGWFQVDDSANKTMPPNNKVNRRGRSCRSSDDCPENYCCVWRRPHRICRRLAGRYRRCNDDQVKGGFYVRHCPCLMGENTCERGYCVP